MKLLTQEVDRIVGRALEEDLGWEDITTRSIVPPNARGKAVIVAKRRGVLAGVDVAVAVFRRLDPDLSVDILTTDGVWVEPGTLLLRIEGRLPGILAGERVALNFLQRLSGIATATARYVQAVAGTKVRIIDTRKTTPGLRVLEKYAVRIAGGFNHRFNLSDGVLIKDNHLAALRSLEVGLRQAIQMAKENVPHGMRVQVEVETAEEAEEAAAAGADALLLDNMALPDMRRVAGRLRGKVILEASGGITLETVRAVAETGVDLISVGALTHSSPALDISMDLEE
ncbi:MAG: carboxylating nicotinate-nucleotide diphosphorylase [Chloroflexi bacterium]|nr:carboxylating nicotinate-nucleotide diphosphorylase [Chloroflexota bacterium]